MSSSEQISKQFRRFIEVYINTYEWIQVANLQNYRNSLVDELAFWRETMTLIFGFLIFRYFVKRFVLTLFRAGDSYEPGKHMQQVSDEICGL